MSGASRFLERWSRLKRAAPQRAVPAAELPPLDSLDADADLTAYLREEAGEALRRQALKKIFSDPRLNVMDGLDVYIDDYSVADPIPEEMLAQMNQARLLFRDETADDAGEAPPQEAAPPDQPTVAVAAGDDAAASAEARSEKEKQTT
jgi:hypothetical protein